MIRWKARGKAFFAGILLIAIGCLRIVEGIQVATHWTGQPMFSFGLIAAGLVLLVAAALPERLISRMAATKKVSK